MNSMTQAQQFIYAQTGHPSERVCAQYGCGNLLFAPDDNFCGPCSGLGMELGYPEDTVSAPVFESQAIEASYHAPAAAPTYLQNDSWPHTLHTPRHHVIQNYHHPSMYNARRAYTHSPMISSPLNPKPEHRVPVKRLVSTSYPSLPPRPLHSSPTFMHPVDVDNQPVPPVLHCTTLGCHNLVEFPGRCTLCLSKEQAARTQIAINPPSVARPLNMASGACKQSCLSKDKTRSKPQKTVAWADRYDPSELEIPVIGEEVDLLESKQAETRRRKPKGQSHQSEINDSGGPLAPVSDPLKSEISYKSDISESMSTPSPPAALNKTVAVSGWGSDLSELSSDESDSDDSKPVAQCIRQTRCKLVIRIPSIRSRLRVKRPESRSDKTEDSSRLGLRRCAIPHCSVLLPPYPPGNRKVRSRKREDLNVYYPWKCCPKCRKRCREYARRKKESVSVDENSDGSSIKTQKTTYTLPYPVYRCLADLLADFEERLDNFLCAQEVVARHRVPEVLPNKRTAFTFTFSGQFWVVSADLDVLPRAGKVMGRVRQALEERSIRLNRSEEAKDQALAISDSPHLSTVLEGGLVRRYQCLHICRTALHARLEEPSGTSVDLGQAGGKSPSELPAGLSTSGDTRRIRRESYTKNAPQGLDTLVTKMVGEVEIAILPNTSHRIYPGETVVVRLKLVS